MTFNVLQLQGLPEWKSTLQKPHCNDVMSKRYGVLVEFERVRVRKSNYKDRQVPEIV
jgi:hypothetical protein